MYVFSTADVLGTCSCLTCDKKAQGTGDMWPSGRLMSVCKCLAANAIRRFRILLENLEISAENKSNLSEQEISK
jgi:hypothetical protein